VEHSCLTAIVDRKCGVWAAWTWGFASQGWSACWFWRGGCGVSGRFGDCVFGLRVSSREFRVASFVRGGSELGGLFFAFSSQLPVPSYQFVRGGAKLGGFGLGQENCWWVGLGRGTLRDIRFDF